MRICDKGGWKLAFAVLLASACLMAQAKDERNPKVIAAREMYHQISKAYGVGASQAAGRPTEGT